MSEPEWQEKGANRGFSYRPQRLFIRNSRPVKVEFGPLEAARDRQVNAIALDFGQGISATAEVDHVVKRSDSSYTLQGHLRGEPESEFSLSIHHEVAVGNFNGRTLGTRELRYVGGGIHKVQEIDDNMAPKCVGMTPSLPIAEAGSLRNPSLANEGNDESQPPFEPKAPSPVPAMSEPKKALDTAIFDVLIAYSTNAKNAEGGTNAILALIYQGIDDTNLAFLNSQVDAQVRLVHTTEVSYSGTLAGDALDAVTDYDGVIDQVHSLRDNFGADFVSFWTPLSDACGVGWLLNVMTTAFDDYAFNVVDPYCQYKYTFTHELGHNLGCAHAVGDTGGRGDGLFSWSHGWRWYGTGGAYYRSVMAYSPGTRTRYYSNPNVYYGGGSTGRAGYEDNAASINASKDTWENFRNSSLDDHGDTIATATTVPTNSTTFGALEEAGDKDVFRFQITSGSLDIAISTTGATDTAGRLLNSSGGQIASATSGGTGGNFRIDRNLGPGTYYVEVSGEGGATGAYQLSISIQGDDHGGDISTATNVSVPGSKAGNLEAGGDEDFFRLVITKSGTLTVNTTGTTDTYGYLLNSSGGILASDDDSATVPNFRIVRQVPPGTYYVRVRGYDSLVTGAYTLVVAFQVISDDHGNESEEATEFQVGLDPNPLAVAGEIEVPGDVDYFRVKVPGTLSGLDPNDGLLDMEGPPAQNTNVVTAVPSYTEDGFIVKLPGTIPTSPPYGLNRIGSGGGWPNRPDNGNAYLQVGVGDKMEVIQESGEPFDVFSIELAEFGTNPPPKTVYFTGYRGDGSTVSHTVYTDGQMDGSGAGEDFEVFSFPPSFGGLVRLEISSGPIAIDNLAIRLTSDGLGSPTGILDLSTTGTTNTFGSWYDASLSLLQTDDSGADGINFRMQREVYAGETYYVKVQETGDDATGAYDLVNSYIPPEQNLPVPPTTVNASENSGTEINLAWSAAPKAVRYVVYRSTTSNSTSASVVAANVIGTSFSDTLAVPGQTYYYWVKSLNANGESPSFSSSDTGVRLATFPRVLTSPQSTSAAYGGDTALSVAAESDSGNLSYQWFEGNAGNTTQPVGGNSAALNLTGLTANSTYWVRVSNAYGSTDSQAATVTVVPGGPLRMTATLGLFSDRVRIGWESSPSSVSYRVYRGLSGNFSQASFLGASSSTQYEDFSASPGTTYYYFVTAVDGDGDEGSYDPTTSYRSGSRSTGALDGTLVPVRDAQDLVFDSLGNRLYITTESGYLEEYSFSTQAISRSFRPEGRLRGLDILPGDVAVLAANSTEGSIHRIDLGDGNIQSHPFSIASGETGAYDVVAMQGGKVLVSPNPGASGARWLR
ncbi:MAG: pre-peptidase C-terminal domain-containing protein [Verrucomicrobiae bacterium]|nr:pre-peptidase C-terminal domain-containing protein [Verrucomicrobiae bacterium]